MCREGGFICMCVCAARVCLVPMLARRGFRSPRNGSTGDYEPLCWELNPGPLGESSPLT